MAGFVFELNDKVEIVHSGERGVVVARVEYVYAVPSYNVRYKSADGRAVEGWWSEETLKRIEA